MLNIGVVDDGDGGDDGDGDDDDDERDRTCVEHVVSSQGPESESHFQAAPKCLQGTEQPQNTVIFVQFLVN